MKKFTLMSSLLIAAIVLLLLGTEVMSQKPTSRMDAFHSSLALEESKEYKKAAQTLEAIYPQHKDDYLTNLRLGWLLYQAQSYDASRTYYERAVSISGGNSVEAMLGATLPLSARNEWDRVAATYASILKLDPANYTANLRLGQIYLNKGQYAEAKGLLEKVRSLYPSAYEANLSLGWTYYYLGNKQKASEMLTTALLLSPGDTLALQGLKLLK